MRQDRENQCATECQRARGFDLDPIFEHHAGPRQGDGRTPEGVFRIDRRNDRSAYHLSLGLDYPRAQDRARAAAGGYDPGGDIMIHGQPNALPDGAVLKGDWTAGCIAVSDDEMEEIWTLVPTGTPIVILA